MRGIRAALGDWWRQPGLSLGFRIGLAGAACALAALLAYPLARLTPSVMPVYTALIVFNLCAVPSAALFGFTCSLADLAGRKRHAPLGLMIALALAALTAWAVLEIRSLD